MIISFGPIKVIKLSLIVIFSVSLLLAPIAKVFTLHTFYFDLGIFENTFYRMTIMGDWQLAFAGHAHWFALMYGWFVSKIPLAMTPYFLVGTQALLVLLPMFFLYRKFGAFIAFAYLSYYPLWANIYFDFHFDYLAIPLLTLFYFSFLRLRTGWAIFSATLLIFVKEPFALEAAACGVLMLWCSFRSDSVWMGSIGRASRIRMAAGGLWLLCVGLGYFYFAIYYLLPYFAPQDWLGPLGREAFGWLGHDLWTILQSIITQPQMIFWEVVSTPGKLIYLTAIFGSLAFIPLLRPIFLIPIAPLLLISMLSRLSNHYDYATHYTAGLIIPVIFAFVYGLPRAELIWRGLMARLSSRGGWCEAKLHGNADTEFKIDPNINPRRENLLYRITASQWSQNRYWSFYAFLTASILFIHIALSPSPVSRLFWTNKVWSYGWSAYILTKRVEIMKSAIDALIPSDPRISISTQNTLNYSVLAHREIYVSFPLGISEPIRVVDWSNRTWEGFGEFIKTGYMPPKIIHDRFADYVVIDLLRPYFLLDYGCEWVYSKCRNTEMERRFLDWVAYASSFYDTVFEQDGFIILRRRSL